MKRFTILTGLFVLTGMLLSAADDTLPRLLKHIQLLAKTTDGTVGVSAVHIETGRKISLRGKESFPMASLVKVPIAVQLLKLVDDGKLALDKMVTLNAADLHPGSGTLTELFFHPGVSLSVENLLELMLVISDNSAADLCLREAGGPTAVTARMKDLHLNGIRVDRNIAILIADWVGMKGIPAESEWNRDLWDRLEKEVPEKEHLQARKTSWADPRDTATPDDMTDLLVQIWKANILAEKSRTELLDILGRCKTGKARIKGLLPEGTEVAHKTGTLGGVVDDAGIITLPGNAGHVAISVFTNGVTKSASQAERAVAEIARSVYDFFTLVP